MPRFNRSIDIGGESGGTDALGRARSRAKYADQFLTIETFRALLCLWNWVEESSALAPGENIVTDDDRPDPWVNLQRERRPTSVLPLSRRSDCQTRICGKEAHLARVIDPAAGAGWYETLIKSLRAAA